MFTEDTSGKEQLEALEAALGFDYGDQDWGIVNADATRLAEFVSFFEQHYDQNWSPWTVAEFVDLVLESASDALRRDASFDVSSIDAFVAQAAPIAPQQIDYWMCRDPARNGEFPVTPHLRALGY